MLWRGKLRARMMVEFCERFGLRGAARPRFATHFALLGPASYVVKRDSMVVLPRRRRWAWGVGACLVALVALLPRSARAQTTTTTGGNCPMVSITVNPVVPRYYPGGDTVANEYPYRPQNLNPNDVNYQDCAADINLEFTLLVGGLPCTDTIWVWAGTTDCTQVSARERNSGSTQCWPVAQIGAFAMSQTSTANIRARDIVAHLSDSATSSTTFTPASPDLDDLSACHSQDAPGSVGLTIDFMAMEPDGQTVDGTSAAYTLNGDLVGPYPPTSVTAGVGENVIIVNWTPAVDSTIQGYNVYCQPLGSVGADTGTLLPEASLVCPDTSTTTTVDDATVTTASDAADCHYVNLLDSGGAGASSCVSAGNILKNAYAITPSGFISDGGEGGIVETVGIDSSTDGSSVPTGAVGISTIPPQYLCGQVGGNTTSSLNVTTLGFDGSPTIKDGVEYAVTVAAFDDDGNVGIISDLSCVTPSPVIDFWTAYTMAGGQAGGGFCALQGAGMPVSSSLFGIGMGATVVGIARRRRRRR
jgi:hypothetical protein